MPEPSRGTATSGTIRPASAATLRDLAARAHGAVRAIDAASGPGSDAAQVADSLRDLAELHPRIVQLQRCVDAETQQGLASYLSALRREVEERLC